MARQVKVDDDRPALIKCDNCGLGFGARVRQKGHEFEEGIKWELDDKRIRCERCGSPNVRKVGTS